MIIPASAWRHPRWKLQDKTTGEVIGKYYTTDEAEEDRDILSTQPEYRGHTLQILWD